MTRILQYVFVVLSAIFLALGYILDGWIWPIFPIIALCILWLIGLVLQWHWMTHVGLVLSFSAAAAGIIIYLPSGYLLAGALFSFVAWDLIGFALRLRAAAAEDQISTLERVHLLRIGITLIVSAALWVILGSVRIAIPFEWMVILMFVTIWGIHLIVNRLMAKQD